ncbi:MAG: bifunctional 5,10-methylenetetrahydrofolate dehydrogenase/5,10-methenyltetrahydrofolate cyclohydrolase [Candidatus Levyibacteriota bacterium]
MKIDGNIIANKILQELKKKVDCLKKKNILPHLAIILIGENHPSKAYVNQKKLKGELIGIKISIHDFNNDISLSKLKSFVEKLNNDSNIHGIIIQRPLPLQIDEMETRKMVSIKKDVDGFLPNSKFNEPIAKAVLEILNIIFADIQAVKNQEEGLTCKTINAWLKLKKIVVVGKGDTGGRPVINLFKKMKIAITIVDSKTKAPSEIIKSADILISTVGKPVIKSNEVKKGAIIIGIGMRKEKNGKLTPDYNQEEVAKIASYYTPVPGGVGPVNVVMLLRNLINSARIDS